MSSTEPPLLTIRRPRPKSADWGGKALIVCALALLMAIPGLFVWALIAERANRADQVIREVSGRQGGAQQVLGPLLVAPYVQTTVTTPTPGQSVTTELSRGWYVVSPETGSAKVSTQADEVKRGIFPVPIYTADIAFDATFGGLPPTPKLPEGAAIDWSRAQLVIGFSDLRGAKSDIVARVSGPGGDRQLVFDPAGDIGLGAPRAASGDPSRSYESTNGFGLVAAPAGDLLAAGGGRITTTLKLTGAQRIAVLPFAKSTTVQVKGVRGAPKFDGGFLPARRDVRSGGFEADWSVPFVARGLADHGMSSTVSLAALGEKDVGVTFIRTNNPYQNVIRALKYAVMFVGLVFLTFFVFEALSGQRLHPAQYILIGLAQMVFYLLLLSLSEYVGFDLAFIVAATATVGLIGLYAGAAFKSRMRAAQALGVFAAIYGLIYLLMRLEDFALLAGSIASFVGLTLVMWLTRNIEWYGGRAEAPAERPAS